MRKFISRLAGTSEESNLKPLGPMVAKINELESHYSGLSDEQVVTMLKSDASLKIRAGMAHETTKRHLWDGVEGLIAGMRHENVEMRRTSIQAFRKMFGVGEFDPNGKPADRKAMLPLIYRKS